jgi:DNA-binding MarR family transcriptional regulator
MKQSAHETIPAPDAQSCAEALLAVAPALMQSLRLSMRGGRGPELSVPQFRVLVHASLRPGATLRQLAEPLGVSTATASRMVETLVLRGLIERRPGEADRRQVAIALTPAGQRMLDGTHAQARAQFESRLVGLDTAALASLAAALELLHTLFEVERRPWAALDEHPELDPEERL